jgi:hypothetical protein
VEHHVVHRDLALSGHTHRQLLGDRLAHGHPAGGDLGDPLAPHRQADRGRLHDGEDVAGPHRDSSGTSPTSGTFTSCAGWTTKAGVHLSVTSRTRSPSRRTTVSTGPGSVSMTTCPATVIFSPSSDSYK